MERNVCPFCFVVAGLLVSSTLLAAPRAAPTTRQALNPARRDVRKADNPAIAAAITELSKTYDTLREKPQGLPAEPDYFREHPATLTPAEIINALTQRLAKDPPKDAYIKWQLLGAIDGELEPALAEKAFALYRRSPPIPPRPGAGRSDDARLNRLLSDLPRDDPENTVAQVNLELQQELDRWRLDADPVARYRDALYTRLPKQYVTLLAGLEDAADRAGAGYESGEMLRSLAEQIRAWGPGASDRRQLSRLASTLEQLAGAPRSSAITGIYWDETMRRYLWERQDMALDQYLLRDLAQFLRQTARDNAP